MYEHSSRLLPPMTTLRCFESAARLGGFSRAGTELGLTQGAISRQIALLEDWLQLQLFDRAGRRVSLNADGQRYLDEIAPALSQVRDATRRAITRRPTNELNVATLPSFGMRWLAPRLPRLTTKFPELIVNFAARSIPFDLSREPFDAAIHFGQPDWPRAHHDLLFREQAIPVCAPALIESKPIASPADLSGRPLLALQSRPDAWAQWFAEQSVSAPRFETPAPRFEQFLMLTQAAVAGAGFALIPTFLIESELVTGQLVCPVGEALLSSEAYYLVHRQTNTPASAFSKFRSWILSEALAPDEYVIRTP